MTPTPLITITAYLLLGWCLVVVNGVAGWVIPVGRKENDGGQTV